MHSLKFKNPVCSINSGIYIATKSLTLSCKDKKAKIFYTIDGTEPSEKSMLYTSRISLNKTTILKAVAIKQKERSETLTVEFTRIENINSVVLNEKPSEKFPLNNIYTLIDGKQGSDNYKDGSWAAFEEKDFEAVVAFQNPTSVSKIKINCMQKTDEKIFFPKQVMVLISPDGKAFINAGELNDEKLISKDNFKVNTFEVKIRTAAIKAIKIVARNNRVCPDGFSGAGEKAWLFVNKISFD